jgi:RNA polymerase sigma-70 factor (ECF subfamily)
LPGMDVYDSGFEEDGALLRSMIAGEEHGFISLYRKYQSRVYHFCLQISGAAHVAEEVTQDTFLALMRAPHKYQTERGPLALYLLGIARNLARKSTRRDRLFSVLEDDWESPDLALPDLANELARKQQVTQIRVAILSLPQKYREVVVLCSLQELSYEEAATVVGTSIGTVRSRMHRAKQLLLKKLKGAQVAEAPRRGSSVLRCEL